MKKFQGQGKNEKVLFFSKEDMIYMFLTSISKFIVIFSIALFFGIGAYLIYQNINIFLMLFFIIILLGIIYLLYLYHNTYVIVTNKRILKFVKNGIFSEHMKELKLKQLVEVSSTQRGILPKILKIGNIKLVGKDKENVIWFKGVKYPKEVVLYISRLKDYILENPDYNLNDIIEFLPRKQRKAK